MKPKIQQACVPFIASAFLLTSCKDETQTKRIKELEQENADRISEVETLGSQLTEKETEINKLRDDLEAAKRAARLAEDAAKVAQRDAELAKRSEEQLRERTRSKAAENPVETSRKAISEKLAAVWSIQGDKASCRGFVAEADGKTWLYFPATGLAGSSKLTVKDGDGNTVTKFGEFQVAADVNLARLEMKQEVPIRLKIDAAATLGEVPRLLIATADAAGGAPKIDESMAGTSTDQQLEYTSYGNKDFTGSPIFSAESGALMGIILPAKPPATTLWETGDSPSVGVAKAARLNRSIDWKPASIGAILSERRKIDELNRMTRLVEAAASIVPGTTGINMETTISGSSLSARQVFEENKSEPAIEGILKLNEGFANQKVKVSESDIKRQFGSAFGQLSNTSRKIATEARAIKPSPIYKSELEASLKWYDDAEKKLAATLAGAGR